MMGQSWSNDTIDDIIDSTCVKRSRDSDVPMVHRWPGKLESLGGEVGAAMCFYVILIALLSRFNFYEIGKMCWWILQCLSFVSPLQLQNYAEDLRLF